MCKEKAIRLRYLEKEEITTLVANCSQELKPIVILAVNTGMRRGEILNIKWTDIDFKRDVICLLETKSDEKREVPMNEAVKDALIKVRRNPKSPYVFCYKNGEQVKDIRKSFWTALKKSGIKDFRFHDLRHSAASHLVMAGIDLNTVREILGHKTIEMTLRYAHLSPNHKKKAVDVLGESIGMQKPLKSFEIVPIWSPEQKLENSKSDTKYANT
jgi:integrase